LEVGEKVNRKLIRTTLADVRNRESAAPVSERDSDPPRERERDREGGSPRSVGAGGGGYAPRSGGPTHSRPAPARDSMMSSSRDAIQSGRKRVPPAETNAEIFYYKKQMDSHTQMVIVLMDGEEIEGTIEWYDRAALKVNRRGAPNILLLKHNIKYMFKAEDRDGGGESGGKS
jgi:sRNA-binding regulator protein Hfq